MSQAGILSVTDNVLPPDVPLVFEGDTGLGASAIANVMSIIGGTNISVDTTSNVITISSISTGGFTWNIVTSVLPVNPIQIVISNAYSCQGAILVTFLLPLAPVLGDTFIIASTTSRFQIAANGGQMMRVGAIISTAGSGTVTSNTAGDFVEFVYLGSNIFQAFSPQGTLTIT